MLAIVLHAEFFTTTSIATYAFWADSLYSELSFAIINLACPNRSCRCRRHYNHLLFHFFLFFEVKVWLFSQIREFCVICYTRLFTFSPNFSFNHWVTWSICNNLYTRWRWKSVALFCARLAKQHISTMKAKVHSFYICLSTVEASSALNGLSFYTHNWLIDFFSCHIRILVSLICILAHYTCNGWWLLVFSLILKRRHR